MTIEEMKHKMIAKRSKKVDYCDLVAVYEIDTETAAFNLVHFGQLFANVDSLTEKINHVYFNEIVNVQNRNVSCTFMVLAKPNEIYRTNGKLRFWLTADSDQQAEAWRIYQDWLQKAVDEIDRKKTYLMDLQKKFGFITE